MLCAFTKSADYWDYATDVVVVLYRALMLRLRGILGLAVTSASCNRCPTAKTTNANDFADGSMFYYYV